MRRLRHRLPWLPSYLGLLVVLIAVTARAQETTAALQGHVKDQTGAVIPGALVEISSPALLHTRTTVTDSFGFYRFAALPPGLYALVASAHGFRSIRHSGLELLVGRLPAVDVILQVGMVAETVEVSGSAPFVDPTTSKATINLPAEIIEGLPKGREFFSLINFAPGARQEPLQSVNQGNTGFQVDGASDGENTYLIEGMDTTDVRRGGLGLIDLSYNMDFVQEMQIKSSGFEAEYGGALGGVINVMQKRGGNAWHGTVFTYYRGDALDASRYPSLRFNPQTPASSPKRISAQPEYYQVRPDDWRRLEAGFTAGGYLLKNRLWLFTGYDPILYRQRRTVNFQKQKDPANNGTHTFSREEDTHNWQTRVDANLGSKLHFYASWVYAYNRATGTSFPAADSPYGQYNSASVTDATSYNAKRGYGRPDSLWKVGGDWQPNPKLILTGWYGYWFSNYRDVGVPSGLRFVYSTSAVGLTGLDGTPVPDDFALPRGYSNIPNNSGIRYDAFTRSSMSYDVSYLRSGWGRHNFKFGYSNHRLSNDLHSGYNPVQVDLYYGFDYVPYGSVGYDNCAQVAAANDSRGLPPLCMGNYGLYTIMEIGEHGKVHSYSHSLYAQDAWTIGHGLTLNFGLRSEKEYLPPYAPGAPSLGFDFGDKIAPRLGVAWDVLRNGQWKIYGNYGRFFDVMKYDLPRAYFGGQYFRECSYTLESPDFTQILPTPVDGRYCPGGGTRPGTLLENLDWRMIVNDPANPLADPHLKPMQQHEFVVGSDYALTSTLGLAARYVRKRLDYAIEDSAVPFDLGTAYFIGNPGFGMLGDLWQRPVTDYANTPAVTYPATCPACPFGPKASRRYDGLEVRLQKRYGQGWFGQLSYTYSRLYGNYSGLTDTFSSDSTAALAKIGGGGGRHSPNINSSFDMLNMQFAANGEVLDGPLPTDRPHTLKLFGFYNLKWRGQSSTLGLTQVVYSGTPVSTVWPADSFLTPQFVEGLGNWVNLHRDSAKGDFVVDGIVKGYRTPAFTQTDMQFTHEVKLSRNRENLRLGVTLNVLNVLNQHAKMGFVQTPVSDSSVYPVDAQGAVDWLALTRTGWDYISWTNKQKRTVNALYGLPSLFQTSRSAYLRVQFSF